MIADVLLAFRQVIEVAQVRVRKRGKTFSYIFEAGKVDGKRKVVEKGGASQQRRGRIKRASKPTTILFTATSVSRAKQLSSKIL